MPRQERAERSRAAILERSKLDLAKALLEEKYGNWPRIVAEIDDSGLRGFEAAAELTQRVGTVFASDVRVRAAMALSQTILPPGPDADPYDHWVGVVERYLAQEDALPGDLSPRELAIVAVQGFFGAYMIAAERGRLDGLRGDIDRLWRAVGATRLAPRDA